MNVLRKDTESVPFNEYNFYVMVKTADGWKKISGDYPAVSDAQAALTRLRTAHPGARLGGSKHPGFI